MSAGYSLSDFAFDLRRHQAPDQLWVTSGWTAAHALPGTVCGVSGCFAPPYAAPDSSLTVEFDIDGRPAGDGVRPGIAGFGLGLLAGGGTWRPDRIDRHGTFHQHRDGRLVSLAVRSRLTPRHGAGGYTLEIQVDNRGDRDTDIALRPRLHAGRPGRVPLAEWGWMPPQPAEPSAVMTLRHSALDARVPAGGRAAFTLGVELGDTAGVGGARGPALPPPPGGAPRPPPA
ncbi:hypothetical protein ABZS66_58235, partial [Dactylosporangium sp. NPDC005572]|uniref:hypothetical protein n=1 Tax=Dactylosporangium sp. NPDC005572 TaxID=3156889 RepID=UPI0033BDFF1A